MYYSGSNNQCAAECKRKVVCVPSPKQRKVCCEKFDIIESHEVVVVEKRIDVFDTALPHLTYTRATKCDSSLCPSAPIVKLRNDVPDFIIGTSTVIVDAGAIDTKCAAEMATHTFPQGYTSPAQLSEFTDIAFYIGSGELDMSIGPVIHGVPPPLRRLQTGAFVYIHAGTPFSFIAFTLTTVFAVYVNAGYLGYLNQLSIYQASVGGIQENMDPALVRTIEKNYCIETDIANSTLSNFNLLRFLPDTDITKCPSGSWGLGPGQFLVLMLETPIDVALSSSSTILPSQQEGQIAFTVNGIEVSLVARILRNPQCGIPDQVAAPTINGGVAFDALVGTAYYVFYDAATNNVSLRPAFF